MVKNITAYPISLLEPIINPENNARRRHGSKYLLGILIKHCSLQKDQQCSQLHFPLPSSPIRLGLSLPAGQPCRKAETRSTQRLGSFCWRREAWKDLCSCIVFGTCWLLLLTQ